MIYVEYHMIVGISTTVSGGVGFALSECAC